MKKEFGLAFLCFFLLLSLVRGDAYFLPYFWDEQGFYILYAYTMFEKGLHLTNEWVIFHSIHPPLFYLLIAAFAKVVGWKLYAVRLICLLTGAALVTGTYALARIQLSRGFSIFAALTFASTPVMLSETAMAQADLPMAAAWVWCLYAWLTNQMKASSILFAITVMTNATAFVYAAVLAWVSKNKKQLIGYFLPTAVIFGAWLAFYHLNFGEWLSQNPDPNHVDHVYRRGIPFMLNRSAHRFFQMFVTDWRWIPSAVVIARFILKKKKYPSDMEKLLLINLGASWIFLSIFGATQQRYFLSVLPLLFVLAAQSFSMILPKKARTVAVAVGLGFCFLQAQTWDSEPGKYSGFEYRSAYRDQIELIQDTARKLAEEYPDYQVVTHWPMSQAYRLPQLGYVSESRAVQEFRTFDEAKKFSAPGSEKRVVVLLYEGERKAPINFGEPIPNLKDCKELKQGIWRMRFCAV